MKPFKTCNGCKAICGGSNRQYCGLGYKTKIVGKNMTYAIISELKPLEICPKPKTNAAYLIETKTN